MLSMVLKLNQIVGGLTIKNYRDKSRFLACFFVAEMTQKNNPLLI